MKKKSKRNVIVHFGFGFGYAWNYYFLLPIRAWCSTGYGTGIYNTHCAASYAQAEMRCIQRTGEYLRVRLIVSFLQRTKCDAIDNAFFLIFIWKTRNSYVFTVSMQSSACWLHIWHSVQGIDTQSLYVLYTFVYK